MRRPARALLFSNGPTTAGGGGAWPRRVANVRSVEEGPRARFCFTEAAFVYTAARETRLRAGLHPPN